MPESPDFEQIALGLMGVTDDEAGQRRIAEQLRQVWNARGAADIEAVGTIYEIVDISDAIRGLDR